MRRMAIALAAVLALLVVTAGPANTQGLEDLKFFETDPTAGVSGTAVSGNIPPADLTAACLDADGLGTNFSETIQPKILAWAQANGGVLDDPDPAAPGNSLVNPGTMTQIQQDFFGVVFGIVAAATGAVGPDLQEDVYSSTFIATFVKLNDIDTLDFDLVGQLGTLDKDTGDVEVTVPTGADFQAVGDTAIGSKIIVATCVEGAAYDPATAVESMNESFAVWEIATETAGYDVGNGGEPIPPFNPGDPAWIEFALLTGPAALATLITPTDFWVAPFCVEATAGAGCEPTTPETVVITETITTPAAAAQPVSAAATFTG